MTLLASEDMTFVVVVSFVAIVWVGGMIYYALFAREPHQAVEHESASLMNQVAVAIMRASPPPSSLGAYPTQSPDAQQGSSSGTRAPTEFNPDDYA